MRPHPKIRKTVKWGGAAASILLAVVWAGSAWCTAGYSTEWGFVTEVDHGLFMFKAQRANLVRGSHLTWCDFSKNPRLDWRSDEVQMGGYTYHFTPLWMFFVPVALVTVAAWRLDRRAKRLSRVGVCLQCGYDRAGLAAGAVCPECGAGCKAGEPEPKP